MVKIVNEKGKLFGLVNLVDLVVILVIIAGVAGISWKLLGDTARNAIAPQVEMTVVARIRGLSKYTIASVEQNPLTGKQMVSGNSYIDAKIDEYRIEEYLTAVTTDDGRILTVSDPERKDIVVKVTVMIPRGTPTPKIGTQEIRVGRTMLVKTRDFEVSSIIESVVIDDGN